MLITGSRAVDLREVVACPDCRHLVNLTTGGWRRRAGRWLGLTRRCWMTIQDDHQPCTGEACRCDHPLHAAHLAYFQVLATAG